MPKIVSRTSTTVSRLFPVFCQRVNQSSANAKKAINKSKGRGIRKPATYFLSKNSINHPRLSEIHAIDSESLVKTRGIPRHCVKIAHQQRFTKFLSIEIKNRLIIYKTINV